MGHIARGIYQILDCILNVDSNGMLEKMRPDGHLSKSPNFDQWAKHLYIGRKLA
jgi:hypothetical protein